MKIITELGIIFGICLVSDAISAALPFSLPGSIIGMVLLLLLLVFRLLKKEQIQTISGFLQANLPFFFVPSIVGLINYLDLLRDNAVKILIVVFVSLVAAFAATVYAVRLTTELMERGTHK